MGPSDSWAAPPLCWRGVLCLPGLPCCAPLLAHMLRPLPRWTVGGPWSICSPTYSSAFPETRAGRHPRHLYRGLLGLHSRCGLRACSASFEAFVTGLRGGGHPPSLVGLFRACQLPRRIDRTPWAGLPPAGLVRPRGAPGRESQTSPACPFGEAADLRAGRPSSSEAWGYVPSVRGRGLAPPPRGAGGGAGPARKSRRLLPRRFWRPLKTRPVPPEPPSGLQPGTSRPHLRWFG